MEKSVMLHIDAVGANSWICGATSRIYGGHF